jgi:glucokinase
VSQVSRAASAPVGRVVSIDIAGSFGSGLRGAVVDASGRILDKKEGITPKTSEGDLVDGIVTMATRLRDLAQRDGQGPSAVGLAVPGPVDEVTGVVHRGASFIVWGDLPLARVVEQRVGLPTVLIQDARAGGRAERLLGAGRGVNDMLLVVIGTGVGAAVICGGQPVRGAFGHAGEIGHIEVDSNGPPCSCGGRGCLETFISEPGLASRYAIAAGQAILANEVISRAARGDAPALKVWNGALRALAVIIGSAVALVECEVVVLSGTMTIPDAALLAPLGSYLDRRLHIVHTPRVVRGTLGAMAGVLGAAEAAFEHAGVPYLARAWGEPG